MKKNGFTLIELLGVIIILSLLMIFALPKIINSVKSSNDKIDALTMRLISNAADLYMEDNQKYYPKSNGNNYCITLQELVEEGYLKTPITLSDSDIDVTNLKSVKATYNNKYQYELLDSNKCVGGNDFIPDASGRVYLSNVTSDSVLDYRIYGNSIQNGIPTPDHPIDVVSLGETKNLFDKSNSSSILNSYISENKIIGNLDIYKTVFIKCKPNTTYTVSKLSGNRFCVGSSIDLPANNTSLTSAKVDYTATSITYKTGNDDKYLVAWVYNSQFDTITSEEMLNSVQIEEGLTNTTYESYIDSINITVSGKNLFDKSSTNFTSGSYLSDTNTIVNSANWSYSDYIPVDGYSFTISNVGGKLPSICGYDKDFNLITCNKYDTTSESNLSNVTITSQINIKYIRFSLFISHNKDIVQIIEGSVATDYEPYQISVTTTIKLSGYEPLRCAGKICDYLDYRNQRIVRNIGKAVLNGNENYISDSYLTNTYRFSTSLINDSVNESSNVSILSNSFKAILSGTSTNDTENAQLSSKKLYFRINKTRLNIEDGIVEGWKGWLEEQYTNGTPVIVYYPLETPVYEPITLPEIKLVSGTSIISFDNNIIPSKLSFNY